MFELYTGIKITDNDYLRKSSSVQEVSRGYKKACLKIHPDKVDSSNKIAHLRATEMFKTVSSSFEAFKVSRQAIAKAQAAHAANKAKSTNTTNRNRYR